MEGWRGFAENRFGAKSESSWDVPWDQMFSPMSLQFRVVTLSPRCKRVVDIQQSSLSITWLWIRNESAKNNVKYLLPWRYSLPSSAQLWYANNSGGSIICVTLPGTGHRHYVTDVWIAKYGKWYWCFNRIIVTFHVYFSFGYLNKFAMSGYIVANPAACRARVSNY